MTKSQEKVLENMQRYKSYKSHRMHDRDLIVECEFEHKKRTLRYTVIVGVRGSQRTIHH